MLDRDIRLVGLGEVLWDVFPTGPRFGGAPANFACSAARLSEGRHAVAMVSGVGHDKLGNQALETLRRKGVDTTCVFRLNAPTGKVDITLDKQGNASYQFAENTAWDNLGWTDDLRELAMRTDAVCFGTLGQRSKNSRQTIQKFVETTPADCLRIFDINLRPPFYDFEAINTSLQLANVLKINDHELRILSEHEGLQGDTPELLKGLAELHHLSTVALTLGSEGSLLWRAGQLSRAAVQETTVVDTVGAGDAFTAAMALGLLADMQLDTINQHASRVAAYVCSQPGATPEFPDEFKRFYR